MPNAGHKVIWLRHGRTAWNLGGRFQGQTDIPLDDEGRAQAERAAAALAALRPDAVVTSDLERARATAQPLADRLGLVATVDPGLRETFAGEWEGLTHTQIRERHGDDLDRWSTGADLRPGGGETRLEVAERVIAAVERARESVPSNGTLVVVTHGGAARAGICAQLGLPPSHWASLGVLTNCSWSVVAQTSDGRGGTRWRLVEYNAGSLPVPAVGDDR
jgi:probable phosphoglycerate mutase